MSQKQYLKMLEREIHKINQKIDLKLYAKSGSLFEIEIICLKNLIS